MKITKILGEEIDLDLVQNPQLRRVIIDRVDEFMFCYGNHTDHRDRHSAYGDHTDYRDHSDYGKDWVDIS